MVKNPETPGSAPPSLLDLRSHGWLATKLGLAMIAAAATESIGLMLLAPMLVALGGQDMQSGEIGGLARSLGDMGIPLAIGPLLAMFVALVVVRAAIVHMRAMVGQSFEVAVVDSLRLRAWSALLHCDWRTLSAMRQSDNASLLITEVDRVGFAINQGISALAIAITLIGVGLAGLALSPGLAAGMAIAGGLTLLGYRGLRRKAGKFGEQLSAAYAHVFGGVQEGLGALRVIKSFGREDATARDLVQRFAGLRRAERAYIRESGLGQAFLHIGGSLVVALGVWLAIELQLAGPAVILPFIALFARALPLLGALQSSWQTWSHCRPAIAKTMALITETEAAREDDALADAPPVMKHGLALSNVTVRFPGRERAALEGVSLHIPAGGIVALVGPSGAGKSTVADLAGGLIAPDAGTVSVDGVALAGGLRRAWRSAVAYVQQDPVLFDGTIRHNLLWASPAADDADLARVLGDASAEFVFALPDGLETEVGEAGHRLSGGERQRLVLARALLRAPRLLILDEATSALDAGNDAAIAAAVARLRGRLTVLIIGHRGALQDIADVVLRLEQGHIATEPKM